MENPGRLWRALSIGISTVGLVIIVGGFGAFLVPNILHTVKLGYNEHAWDRLILFVIAVIRYNREDLCTKVAIWDQKFQL